jgi:type IV secretory pathway VirB4 component
MMNLTEYRRRSQSLADFLPWAALVDKGVILNKDGSFQRTARFRGPDLDSATPAELVAITGRLNNALRRLGSGWAIFIEAQRQPANRYPESVFPDAASGLVDAERRAQFEEEGAHFESRYFLTLLWLPLADDSARAEAWLHENRTHDGADWRAALDGFVDRTDRVLALVEGFMPEAEWLDDGETLTYLHSCVSTRRQRVRVPEMPMYLDAVLVDEDLTGGLEPRLGRAHLRTLTIMGFPSQTNPGFAGQLREWLKTLRKKNASVIFATQSLADIDGSSIAPAIIESCPTRLFLPNERALEPQIAAVYRRFGLNDRQIEILSRSVPKRDYYCQSRRGNRLFELGLSEVALAFTAASSKSDQALISELVASHGRAGFAAAWLRAKGLDWAAEMLIHDNVASR